MATTTGQPATVASASRRFDWSRLDPVWITFVVLLGLWLFSMARQEGFRTVEYNLFTLRVAAFLAVVAIGQTFVVLMGGIDLSVAAVVTMAGVIGGNLITQIGEAGGIIATIVLCALVGMANGLGVVLLRLPPLVMTLASLSVIQGVLLVYNAGKPVSGESPFLEFWALGTWLGVPSPVWLVGILTVASIIVLHRTAYGRAIYAIGNNVRAAQLSGIQTGLTQIVTYGICATSAGITGLLLLGRTGYSSKTAGDPYLLMSIAAVVIGGTSILGGRGKVVGTIGGALLLTVLISVLTVESIPEAGRMIVQGILILVLLIAYATSDRA